MQLNLLALTSMGMFGFVLAIPWLLDNFKPSSPKKRKIERKKRLKSLNLKGVRRVGLFCLFWVHSIDNTDLNLNGFVWLCFSASLALTFPILSRE